MIQLDSDKGFPFNFRPAKEDQLAYDLCVDHFGRATVKNIQSKLHRSVMSYSDLIDDLNQYDRQHTNRPTGHDAEVYALVLQTVKEEWVPREKIIPLTLGGVEAHPDLPLGKSPCLPYKMRGFKTKGDVLNDPESMREIHGLWQMVGRGRHTSMPDCALFARAQIASIEKNKIRATWGYPMAMYLEEGRFFYPYLKLVKEHVVDVPIGYQTEMSTGGMKYVNDMIRSNPHAKIVIQDWSKFDKTVPAWLIRDCFSILAECFDFSRVRATDDQIYRVRADRSVRRWKKLVSYFINTPIRTPKGERFLKTAGVPSGSCFTNIIDTMINQIVTRYICYSCTGHMPVAELYLGDDSLNMQSGVVNLEDQAKLALDVFGMVLNTDKSYVTSDPRNAHFLGYFNNDGHPLKAQDFSIISFIQPEHTIEWDPVKTASRALGQLYCCFDGSWGNTWLRLIHDLCTRTGITYKEIEAHIRANPWHFKYLVQAGIDPRSITLPVADAFGLVWKALPAPSSRKTYKRRVFDLHNSWKSILDLKECVDLESETEFETDDFEVTVDDDDRVYDK